MDVKNFFVCTDILEFVKELTSTIPIHEVMNIWKYIAVQAWMFFRLYFRNCKSYLYNCDDLPSYNPNTDSCLPQTWIVLAFPKVSPAFSGFDEYMQDVPRSIAWSGAHRLWFSLHDMIGAGFLIHVLVELDSPLFVKSKGRWWGSEKIVGIGLG